MRSTALVTCLVAPASAAAALLVNAGSVQPSFEQEEPPAPVSTDGSSCTVLLRGWKYVSHTKEGSTTLLVPSTPEAPGVCCAACDKNVSCAAWTLEFNHYNQGTDPHSSSCTLLTELPQRWAVTEATPAFECIANTLCDAKQRDAPCKPGTGGVTCHHCSPPFLGPNDCVNFTQGAAMWAISGHKPPTRPDTLAPAKRALDPAAASPPKGAPNVLHLVADDMRPQLKCYGHDYMITPNLDKLAATGTQFDFAYTQFAYCAPSRNSFLSGRRPDRTTAISFLKTFRERPGGTSWVSMPQLFKDQGWWTSAAGKIYHDGENDWRSWGYPSKNTAWIQCVPGDVGQPKPNHRAGPYKPGDPEKPTTLEGNETDFNPTLYNYCTVTENSTNPLTNENISLTLGLERMDLAHASGRPWWISIGVHRPHWPWRGGLGFGAAQLYPNVSLPKFPYPPTDSPYMAGNFQGSDVHDKGVGSPVTIAAPERTAEYRRYYYAALTWSDHMLGKALDRLQAMGPSVSERTITIFHSDHGYQLGELNEWSKKTNTELATRVPLLIRVPWLKASVGVRSQVLVELVDLYRTVADLAELTTHVQASVQGVSLAPLLRDPSHPPSSLIKPAFSQIARCACGTYTCHDPPRDRQCNDLNQSTYDGKSVSPGCNPFRGRENRSNPATSCSGCTARYRNGSSEIMPVVCGWSGTECGANACAQEPENAFNFMGYTMRTATGYRFTAWVPWDKTRNATDWNKPMQYELFNLTADDGRDMDFAGFSVNLAERVENAELVKELKALLYKNVLEWP